MQFLLRHGYPLLFGMVLAEQLGAPIPSAPVLLAMGALIGDGNYTWADALVLSLIACLMADGVWYDIGCYKGSSVLRLLCRVSLEPDSYVLSTRRWFMRLDGWALMIASRCRVFCAWHSRFAIATAILLAAASPLAQLD